MSTSLGYNDDNKNNDTNIDNKNKGNSYNGKNDYIKSIKAAIIMTIMKRIPTAP